MSQGQGPAERLFGATKRLIASLLSNGEARLRLAVVELEEERARLFILLLLAGISLLMVMLGLTVLTLFVVVLFWETHRLMAIGASAMVLLGGGLGLAAWAVRLAKRPTLLKSTLKHLATDRALMETSRDD
ncbi:phage holin family protein [Franzmannia qiaohouensis]|uniref:Phage holin family protein n=1 Tax=Franzmannia qiaohouensis TaxID=1329370 RepID=A0ABU1HD11_9GAMM|nr:phage holin family protein [Halomonas qiaohouensis]MDR5904883.1 phage holin family protein [Halomonas qiaohouensis]